jgi:cyclopropane fatty-acyl-phospholipid synthase-like methyltransferase
MLVRSSLLFLALMLVGCAHEKVPDDRHRFDDAQCWAARFEDPARDGWQKPDEVLRFLAVPDTAKVADIGAATGYFPVRFARAVPKGRVYGVDVETAMVDYLATRAKNEELKNLTAVLAAYDDPKIPEPVDLITVIDTYHHIDERPAYFRRLAASLRPAGRLAIIDFRPGSKMGPREKLSAEVVEAELAQAGYKKLAQGDFLPEQYLLVFGR